MANILTDISGDTAAAGRSLSEVEKSAEIRTARNLLMTCAVADCDPTEMLKILAATMDEWNADSGPEMRERVNREVLAALPIVALDTHYLAAEAMSKQYRPFVVQFAGDLVAEYQCHTPSEKALAEAVALSYGRILEISKEFTRTYRIEYLSAEKNGYYGLLAKELDRAHRQFTSSLLVLKQLKSPTLEVNIRAKTAFVATNQQINVPIAPPPVSDIS